MFKGVNKEVKPRVNIPRKTNKNVQAVNIVIRLN